LIEDADGAPVSSNPRVNADGLVVYDVDCDDRTDKVFYLKAASGQCWSERLEIRVTLPPGTCPCIKDTISLAGLQDPYELTGLKEAIDISSIFVNSDPTECPYE
jgi:hypothetical protein